MCPGPVKRKGEAVLERGGGPGQTRAAGRGGGRGGQEEGPPDQDQAGTQRPAERQPEAEGVSWTAGEQGPAEGL